MRKWLSICHKEWLLLWRDKMGLAIIFILPMILVFFICLTKPADASHSQKYRVLLLDQDKSVVSSAITKALNKVSAFKLTVANKKIINLTAAKAEVASGRQQVLIVVPRYTSRDSARYFRDINKRSKTRVTVASSVQIWTDAALPSAVVDGMKMTINNILQTIELQTWRTVARKRVRAKALSDKNLSYITSNTQYVQVGSSKKPSVLQQNVPAWSLFGMFFIVIPLASIMVRERHLGIMLRLRLAPVSMFTLYSGRLVAFVIVNLCQLFLMFIMGVTVLPAVGLGDFSFMPHFF
ncbi:MAG: ABC transporter permease, partial [Candidatus Thioglobus sp.]